MIPRFLRPSRFIRRWTMRRGLRSNNDLVRFFALVYVGRTAFLRTNATRRGVYGREGPWQALAAVFFVGDIVKKLTGREVEIVSTERLEIGDSVVVTRLPLDARREK
jgi:hypothetical protein